MSESLTIVTIGNYTFNIFIIAVVLIMVKIVIIANIIYAIFCVSRLFKSLLLLFVLILSKHLVNIIIDLHYGNLTVN